MDGWMDGGILGETERVFWKDFHFTVFDFTGESDGSFPAS